MRNFTLNMHSIKWALAITTALISIGSLLYSHRLTGRLLDEEVGKMEVWAEAMRSLQAADEHTDLNLVLKVINSNHSIPVIFQYIQYQGKKKKQHKKYN